MNIEDLSDCYVTFEQHLAKLEEIENILAKRWSLDGYIEDINYHGTIREHIIYVMDKGHHDEDDVVKEWNQHFSWYMTECKYEFLEKYIELHVFVNLVNYAEQSSVLSYVNKTNIHYLNILNSGKLNVIPALLKYIGFAWVVFILLHDISGNDMSDFPQEHAGMLDEVTEYWLNWGKKQGYI